MEKVECNSMTQNDAIISFTKDKNASVINLSNKP